MKYYLILIILAALISACARGEQHDNTSREENAGVGIEVEYVHPEFRLTSADFTRMISGLPEDIRTSITGSREDFFSDLTEVLSVPEEQLLLVDKAHPLPPDYAPDDLVDLQSRGFILNREGLQLRKVCIPDLKDMDNAAREAGLRLVISSAYRSYNYQEQVFTYHVKTIGEEQAKRESAEPGKSQHQLGTTVDFGSITPAFGNTPEGKWLLENGWKFGFSLSYPEGAEDLTGYIHEIWHYRWIGKAPASFERRFFGGIQQYMLEFLHRHGDSLKAAQIAPAPSS